MMPSIKQQFIHDLFWYLLEKEYTLLKWDHDTASLGANHSDLDILMQPALIEKVLYWIENDDRVALKNKFVKQDGLKVYLLFKNKEFLQIDFLTRLIRKEIEYMTIESVFSNTRIINNIKTYETHKYFEHVVLFSFLNKSGISDKHYEFFIKSRDGHFCLSFFNGKYGTNIESLEEVRTYDEEIEEAIRASLKSYARNRGFRKCGRQLCYIGWSVRNVLFPQGKMITFSGVDGAGKSTVLSEFSDILASKYRQQVIVLRHRPSLLPILSSFIHGKKQAEENSMSRLPRTGAEQGKVSSLLRFLYYYLDYFFGQFVIRFRYLSMGYIVLYDRYYYDFILDGRRSSVDIGSKLPKLLYRFLINPSINLFLYAKPEVILARKQELSAQDITSLTRVYQNLFNEYDARYDERFETIENIDLSTTLAHIECLFVESELTGSKRLKSC